MDDADHRAVAIGCFNRCWELLETEPRTDEQDIELLTEAFTSRHHWMAVGAAEQWIIADWMVSRAAATLGFGDLALRFAERAYAAGLAEGTPDWLHASTAEGVARAFAAADDLVESEAWCAVAAHLVERIADEDDRAVVAGQLADLRGDRHADQSGAD